MYEFVKHASVAFILALAWADLGGAATLLPGESNCARGCDNLLLDGFAEPEETDEPSAIDSEKSQLFRGDAFLGPILTPSGGIGLKPANGSVFGPFFPDQKRDTGG